MKYHFTYALILTPFESSLTPLDWESVVAQDYPIHALYCEELGALLFHSDNQKNDCTNMISFLKETFKILNIFKCTIGYIKCIHLVAKPHQYLSTEPFHFAKLKCWILT